MPVRMLFSFVGGPGHFNPLIPIANAARAAGHEVAVTGRPSMVPTIAAAGFVAFATGTPAASPWTKTELEPPDAEREARIVREVFAGRVAHERAAAIIALGADWQPDLIVCDEMDFGAMVVAERLSLPYASVQVIASGSFSSPELLAEPLQALRAEYGLPPDPELVMLRRYLVLSPFPPSYRDPRFPLPATAHALRTFGLNAAGDGVAPPWLAELGEKPTVYFTLGTEFNLESGDLLARVIAALRELPITLIATVGREIDPAELQPQPANVRIEQYIPQAALLPRCRAVVSHGGSGTVIGALAHGLPQVLIPLGADQLANAARCTDLGVGRVLDAMTITPDLVREAVSEVLTDPSYRQQAARIKAEVAGLPGPAHAVTLLERLAADQALLPDTS
jgi:UDP:flavonoid glycosyltransferase YjiC (YdhE family)